MIVQMSIPQPDPQNHHNQQGLAHRSAVFHLSL